MIKRYLCSGKTVYVRKELSSSQVYIQNKKGCHLKHPSPSNKRKLWNLFFSPISSVFYIFFGFSRFQVFNREQYTIVFAIMGMG